MTILDLLLGPLRSPRATERYPEIESPPTRGVRGTPVLDSERCEGVADCMEVCPTRAITLKTEGSGVELRLDYGLCIFCGECVRACPSGAITARDTFELAQVRREDVVAAMPKREVDDA